MYIYIFRVILADQTTYDAKVVGFDQDKDVAVLRIDAPKDKLRPILVGVSADLLVGQSVCYRKPLSLLSPSKYLNLMGVAAVRAWRQRSQWMVSFTFHQNYNFKKPFLYLARELAGMQIYTLPSLL